MKLGDLRPTRDLTFVKDTVKGFTAIAESEDTIGEEINIASEKEINIGDLARKLIERINPEAVIINEDQRNRPAKSEVFRLLGSKEKITRLTGWEPEISLDQGLEMTVEWFKQRENLGRYKSEIYNV